MPKTIIFSLYARPVPWCPKQPVACDPSELVLRFDNTRDYCPVDTLKKALRHPTVLDLASDAKIDLYDVDGRSVGDEATYDELWTRKQLKNENWHKWMYYNVRDPLPPLASVGAGGEAAFETEEAPTAVPEDAVADTLVSSKDTPSDAPDAASAADASAADDSAADDSDAPDAASAADASAADASAADASAADDSAADDSAADASAVTDAAAPSGLCPNGNDREEEDEDWSDTDDDSLDSLSDE